MMAASLGENELVDLLLRNKANIECKNVEGSTALDLAITHFNLNVVVLLLSHGAKLDFSSDTVSAFSIYRKM